MQAAGCKRSRLSPYLNILCKKHTKRGALSREHTKREATEDAYNFPPFWPSSTISPSPQITHPSFPPPIVWGPHPHLAHAPLSIAC